MSEFVPVSTIEDLETLDPLEIRDGYWSGFEGDGEPGNNHSRSFWHGWRNGAMDKGMLAHDASAINLARAVIAAMRSGRLNIFGSFEVTE
jgi:hypothetical protein